MDKQQIIEKIKKCLKLGKGSDFQGEAEQAMAAAMRLAAGIGMTIDQIKLNGEAENGQNDIAQNTVGGKARSKIPQWEVLLATGLAHSIGCEMVIHTGWNEKENKTIEYFLLIGTQVDAALFDWLYPFVISQLRRLCHRDWKFRFSNLQNLTLSESDRKYWERSWYRGASLRVVEMAKVRFKEQTSEQEQQQYALVVRDKQQACQQYMQQKMSVKTYQVKSRSTNRSAMMQGYESGAEVSMNHPIE